MKRKRFALVLGVNDYPADPQINALVGAKADALAMYVFLLTKLRFDHVQLVQPEESGTFLDTVEKCAADLGPEDLLLVFYAGHGFEVNHKHYLLTPGDKLSRLRADQGTMHKEVLAHGMRGRGCQRVLITDSCRSALVGHRGGAATRESVAIDRDLARRETQDRFGPLTLFDACDEGKTAAELKPMKTGLFTRSLLEVWEARLAGARPVTIDTQVQTDVAQRMRATAAEYGMDGAQSPWLQNSGPQPVLSDGAPAGWAATARPAPPPAGAWKAAPPPFTPPSSSPRPPPAASPLPPVPPSTFSPRVRRPTLALIIAFLILWFLGHVFPRNRWPDVPFLPGLHHHR